MYHQKNINHILNGWMWEGRELFAFRFILTQAIYPTKTSFINCIITCTPNCQPPFLFTVLKLSRIHVYLIQLTEKVQWKKDENSAFSIEIPSSMKCPWSTVIGPTRKSQYIHDILFLIVRKRNVNFSFPFLDVKSIISQKNIATREEIFLREVYRASVA